jgi:hypothetical protein
VETLVKVFYNNPARFFGQSPAFKLRPIRVEEL